MCVWGGGGGASGVNGEEGMGVFPITDPLGYVPSLIRSMFCGSISSRRGLALKAAGCLGAGKGIHLVRIIYKYYALWPVFPQNLRTIQISSNYFEINFSGLKQGQGLKPWAAHPNEYGGECYVLPQLAIRANISFPKAPRRLHLKHAHV